jgi:phosphoglycolate phosphatase
MIKYDYIIWDFNGTLLDDVMTGILSVNTLLRERSLPTIPDVEYYRSIFRFPIIDYYKALGFDFESEPYEVLAPKWVALYLENVKNAGAYSDVKDTLEYVKKLGMKQTIISASELSMLCDQLSVMGIKDYFEEVLGLDNIHAGSKLALADDWRERHPNSKALFIGDTDHDVQTAKALGADCVLVARGHQSKEALSKLGVTVLDDLSGLSEIIE